MAKSWFYQTCVLKLRIWTVCIVLFGKSKAGEQCIDYIVFFLQLSPLQMPCIENFNFQRDKIMSSVTPKALSPGIFIQVPTLSYPKKRQAVVNVILNLSQSTSFPSEHPAIKTRSCFSGVGLAIVRLSVRTALMTAPSWCGLGCHSRIDGGIDRSLFSTAPCHFLGVTEWCFKLPFFSANDLDSFTVPELAALHWRDLLWWVLNDSSHCDVCLQLEDTYTSWGN
jgi:hypothetical protein